MGGGFRRAANPNDSSQVEIRTLPVLPAVLIILQIDSKEVVWVGWNSDEFVLHRYHKALSFPRRPRSGNRPHEADGTILGRSWSGQPGWHPLPVQTHHCRALCKMKSALSQNRRILTLLMWSFNRGGTPQELWIRIFLSKCQHRGHRIYPVREIRAHMPWGKICLLCTTTSGPKPSICVSTEGTAVRSPHSNQRESTLQWQRPSGNKKLIRELTLTKRRSRSFLFWYFYPPAYIRLYLRLNR